MTRWKLPLALLGLLWLGRAVAQTPVAQDVVRAEAPIVAGNAVNAKKLALANAFRQATEQALAELVKQSEPLPSPVPAGLGQLKASLGNGAQKYVRSYRLIEEQSEGGVFKVMVEIDVDEVLLRRELDKIFGAAAAQAQPAGRAVASVLLVGGSAAAKVVAALGPQGVRTQLDAAPGEPQLLASALRQNAFSLFVTLESRTEERVRGTIQIPVRCTLAWRLFLPGTQPTGGPAVSRSDEAYGFATDAGAAQSVCVERAVAALARSVLATLRTPVESAPFVTLQLEMPDPGSVPPVLQALKRLGAVVATEVRTLTATRADIRVFTRISGPALFAALGRELGGKLALAPTQPLSHIVAVKVQTPEAPPAAP